MHVMKPNPFSLAYLLIEMSKEFIFGTVGLN